jgi:hypothetical protein
MEIISNDNLIKRNARIGQITSVLGLLVLAGGMFISFTRQDLFYLSMIALVVGFALSQVGIYFGNRWGRRPRPDEQVNTALKGLDGRYNLYHYRTPTSHLLVGPAGVWVLLPRTVRGTITYDEQKQRWRQRGGNVYLKIFAQEGLGRPDLEASAEVETTVNYLQKLLPDLTLPDVQAILLFTSEKAEVEADNAPIPTLHIRKLKEFIRKTAKSKTVPPEMVKQIQQALPD